MIRYAERLATQLLCMFVYLSLFACGDDFVIGDSDGGGDVVADADLADADLADADLADTSLDTEDPGLDANGPDANHADAGPSDAGGGTDAEPGVCDVDEHVQSNRCVPCTGGTARAAGDDPTGADTECAADACTPVFGISCFRFEGSYLKGERALREAWFGMSIDLDGDTLVVGAPRDGDGGRGIDPDSSSADPAMDSGAVYVFRRRAEGWSQEAYIKASNADEYDRFGWSVAIDGDTLVVGAPYEESSYMSDPENNEDFGAGAAYIYQRIESDDGPVWDETVYLKTSPPVIDQDYFGWDVDISGDTVVVGTPGNARGGRGTGAVNVFVRVGAIWQRGPLLQASNRELYDGFGESVAIDGDTLVAGATQEDGPTNTSINSGAAYVFQRVDGTWAEEAYLRASNADTEDTFGQNVALDGDTVVVAALGEDSNGDESDNSASNSGAVYVFVRSGTTWSQSAYLKSATVRAEDGFGIALSVEDSTLAIGAFLDDGSTPGVNTPDDNGTVDVGAVYLFERGGGDWAQSAYIHAPNLEASDLYGRSLVLDGPTLAIGASLEDSSATGLNGNSDDNTLTDSGAVYIHRVAP